MDADARTLLKGLADGHAQLVDGQVQLAKELANLAKEQANAAKELANLRKELANLGREQAVTSAELRALGKRMDKYAAAVVRGFTNGAGRDHGLEKRLDSVDRRVRALERRRS